MKPANKWVVITLTIMTVMTDCCRDNDESDPANTPSNPGTIKLTSAQKELVDSVNAFSFNLFNQIIESRKENESLYKQSIIVSPLSITYALSMLNNGAAGNTQAQIKQVLGFIDTGLDSINEFCKKMMESVPTLDPRTKVMIANNIYVNKNYELKQEFTQAANTYYNAYPETRDFHDGKTLVVINRWASDHTEKMIDKILDESNYNPDAVSYLLNAIYFKGIWANKFDKNETVDEEFRHLGYSTDVSIRPMMHQNTRFGYTEIDGYQVLRLRYGNRSFQMTILLPMIIEYEDVLTPVPLAETWSKIDSMIMSSALVDVKLPRFETSTDLDLQEIMSSLGMPDAFDPDMADFSNFCNTPTYIGLMKQVAKIKLDEEGTEAAAVTVTGMLYECADDMWTVAFHANHPFLYVISECSTGAILFLGQYTGY